MKGFWILIVCALILSASWVSVCPAAPTTVSAPVGFVPAGPATAPVALDEPTLAEQPQGMNFFERRRYGLTVRKLKPLVEEVVAEGKIDPSDSTAMAAAVLKLHIQDNAGIFTDKPEAINWDTLLEFIERLLPLILQIIALFS